MGGCRLGWIEIDHRQRAHEHLVVDVETDKQGNSMKNDSATVQLCHCLLNLELTLCFVNKIDNLMVGMLCFQHRIIVFLVLYVQHVVLQEAQWRR